MEDICFCDTLVQLDKCYWMTPALSDFYFVRKQLYSAKTSRFQLQLIASVRKYNYSADSTSFVQNFEFCLYNRRETRKSTFFDIKIDFSNKDTCFWDVLVELKDCYLHANDTGFERIRWVFKELFTTICKFRVPGDYHFVKNQS